jgi:iron complex outermembrane receptor protein
VGEVPVYLYTQQDAEFYGVEVDSRFTLASFAGGDLRLGVFGDSIRGKLDSGADAPRLPPLRVGGKLSWSSEHWELWGRVLDAAEQDRPGVNEESTDAYTRWDLGAEYRLPFAESEMVAFVNFRNITDEEIRLSTSFLRDVAPEAGRSIEAGIRFSF